MQIVAYDFGIKHNILRRLASFGCKITVVPADYPASKVLDMNPDGIFLSNGPVSAVLALSIISPVTWDPADTSACSLLHEHQCSTL